MDAEKKFHEKLMILNKEFLNFLERALEEMPYGDFSPSCQDYIKNVNELDQLYGTPSAALPEPLSSNFIENYELTNNNKNTNSNTFLNQNLTKNNTGLFNKFEMLTNTPKTTLVDSNDKNSSNQNSGILKNGTTQPLKFLFGAPKEQETDQNDKDSDQEPDPPKVDEVEQVEKDALCFFKCAVYNFINGKYEKKGVAYISIKLLEGDKKQLIIREATTLGRILTNTIINENFKYQKIAEKNLRISYPVITNKDNASKEAETILLRFGLDENLNSLVKEFEKS